MRIGLPRRGRAAALFALALAAAAARAAALTPRSGHSASLLPTGHVLVAGGVNQAGTVLSSADLLLTAKDGSSISAASMNVARASHTATMMANGRLLAAGGWDGTTVRGDVEVYDPATNAWTLVAGMSSARFNHTATLLNDGRVLICGGQSTAPGLSPVVTAACDLFTPSGSGGSLAAGPSLQQARALHAATLLRDGKVWFSGGWNPAAGSVWLPTTERFDPSANAFSSAQPLSEARSYHTATMMGDGKVLVAGGFNAKNDATTNGNRGILQSAEIYDPVANNVSPAGPLAARRELHSASLSPDGAVMIYGGLGNIATTYLSYSGTFKTGSTLTDTFSGQLSTGNITGASASLDFDFLLGTPVAGTIADGEIVFSSPVAHLQSGTAYFVDGNPDNPAVGLRANLSGVSADCVAGGSCGHIATALSLQNMQGKVFFRTLSASLSGNASGGSLAFTPSPLTSAAALSNLVPASSNLQLPVAIAVPAELQGAVISSGAIAITAGSFTQTSSYTVTLTGGNVVIPADTPVTLDSQGNTVVAFTATVQSPRGTIAWEGSSGGYSVSSPVPVPQAGAPVAVSLTGNVSYVANQANLTGVSFTVNAATVVIRSMVFGDAEFFNPQSNAFSFSPPSGRKPFAGPSVERFGHTATLLVNGDVLLAAGRDCAASPCTSFISRNPRVDLLLMPLQNNFSAASGSLSAARALHTATLLTDGTILAAGGTNGANVLGTAEIFNPDTETFAPTAGTMRDVRDLHTATLLPNGRVLLAGGFTTNAASTGSTSACEIYYSDTRLFRTTGALGSARSNHTATLMSDGSVVAAGGYGPGDVITGTVEVYYSTAGVWRSLPAMPSGRERALHTATLLKDGRLMLAGGINGSSGVLSTVIAYDPATNAWASLAAMPHALRSHSATLLPDGRVLAAGGNDGFGQFNASYIYDPILDAWSETDPTAHAPLLQPRFGHTATLLPNGTVMISGGATSLGSVPSQIEVFHMDASSWAAGGFTFALGTRGFHTMTLAGNGRLYAIGGGNGLIGGSGTSLYASAEKAVFTLDPDQFSKGAPPSLRQSTITSAGSSPTLPGGRLTVVGQAFRGGTEAGGGGAAAANSSLSAPRLVLQRLDGSGGGASQSDAGFAVDLTTQVFLNSDNFATLDSSVTVALPATAAQLPMGWYHVRVGANDVHSGGRLVQVGPALPTAAPASLTGTLLGVSSISWTWSAVSGAGGYNVYQATSGVFLGTAPAVASPSFLQTDLPPDTGISVVAAAFTLSGDGPRSTSTVVSTPARAVVNGLAGTPLTTASIQWSWLDPGGGASFRVYNSTTGQVLATSTSSLFLDAGLGVNTARSIRVSAVTAAGEGPLSEGATVYTLAAAPAAAASTIVSLTTGSFSAQWTANGNPSGTRYQFVSSQLNASPLTASTITTTGLLASPTGLSPGEPYGAAVYALNGDSVASSPLTFSTYTLSQAPSSLQALGTTPSSISISWSNGQNSTATVYQVTASTDAFAASVSTPVAFSAAFHGSSATLTSLLTSTTYWIRVQARNPVGQLTAFSNTITTAPANGGAPAGSLGGTLTSLGASTIQGTLGNGRSVTLRAPSGAFPSDVAVVISSHNVAGTLCPNGVNIAVSLAETPAFQPTQPVYLTLSYLPAELGGVSTDRAALMRFEPAASSCVPLETVFDPANRTLTARLNHFSLYQVAQIPAASTAETARLFPNPYHVATDGFVTIDQIPPQARVRVMTLRGAVVLDQTAGGTGVLTWSGTNAAGRPVASGLYLVVIESGSSRKVLKLAVIR